MAQEGISVILAALDQAFDHKSWHGTNLRGALRRVSVEMAAWRPAAGRHNIWELTLHAAYWKYTVRKRLLGEGRGSIALKGANFWERPAAGASGETDWKKDVAASPVSGENYLLAEIVAGRVGPEQTAPKFEFD